MINRRDENCIDHKCCRRVVDGVGVAVIERVDLRITWEIGAVEDGLHTNNPFDRRRAYTARPYSYCRFR